MAIKIALAGNPNSGKTTLFNALTGSNQYVGNWPGVTVEKKEGKLIGNKDVTVTDLPGIYSLSPYTLEEVVSRNYLLDEKPDVILNIVDGTNLERNLYLSTQLMELGIPMVIAINMMDVVRKNGDKIDTEALSKLLKCPVVEISALKGTGIDKAAELAIEASHSGRNIPGHSFSGNVEHALAHIEEAVLHDMPECQQRWYAIKIFERDEKILEKLNIPADRLAHIERDIKAAELEADDDAESIITNERYIYIASIVKGCYKKKNAGMLSTSDKIDKVMTNRWLALPIFAVIMFLVYYISVTTIGTWLTDWANDSLFGDGSWSLFGLEIPGIAGAASAALTAIGAPAWLHSLLVDGIIAGVGAVLGFVPQLLVLFILLAFLESCGYMSRVAFILDRIFRKFGLSGKSFIPILIGTGCGVPGIMASRTIENPRDRKITIMTTCFIPCGAKLPIIGLISGALFGGAWWVAPSAYFIGMAAIIISGIILKKTRALAGEPAVFVMELPAYHWPTVGTVLRSMWERGWSFIKKAGTVILLASIIIWGLSSFGSVNGRFGMVEPLYEDESLVDDAYIAAVAEKRDISVAEVMPMDDSLLADIGSFIAPVFRPLGFDNWKPAVATITGLLAKEEVIGTFGILYNYEDTSGGEELGDEGEGVWKNVATDFENFSGGHGKLAAFVFMIFNLLCAPCFAAMGAIKREMNNGKWTLAAIGYMCLFAYVVGLITYQFGLMFGGSGNIFGFIAGILLLAFGLYMLFRPAQAPKSK